MKKKKKKKKKGSRDVRTLPYRPIEILGASVSAFAASLVQCNNNPEGGEFVQVNTGQLAFGVTAYLFDLEMSRRVPSAARSESSSRTRYIVIR